MRAFLLTLYFAALLGTVALAFHDLGIERVRPSSILVCMYVAGGLITAMGGYWLANRKDIETPWVLTLFWLHEVLLILFIALWPILGLIAISEIVYRAASRRPRSEVSDDMKRHV